MKFVYDGGVLVYSYRNGRRLFLFLRTKTGWLDIPKGHTEEGEQIIETAIRETKEETGLSVEPDLFFRHAINYWTTEDGQHVRKNVAVFMAEIPAIAKVKISREHAGYKWLTYGDAMRLSSFKDTKELLKDANDYIDRKEAMEKLNIEYRKLPSRTRGWELSRNFVAGEGPLNAKVVLVGQAPGRNEDETGRPFVGISGQLLGRLLHKAGLRREHIYITSVVQFFPPKNRAPSDKETSACKGFLLRQLEIINPELVIVVGAVALRELLGIGEIMKVHGNLIKRDCSYFVTLHPAAAVRIKRNMPIIENDFRRLKSVLAGL